MKIVDCFAFYNELDILHYRLRLLYDYVDHFVICEATRTFAGADKPLYFKDEAAVNDPRFAPLLDKIIFVVDDGLSANAADAWGNDFRQKNTLHRGIVQCALEDGDYLILADADEIPDPRVLEQLRTTNAADRPAKMFFDMFFYYYNLTCLFDNTWPNTKMISYAVYKAEYWERPNDPRFNRSGDQVCMRGGWHMSYFGDAKFIANKIRNFAHQEYNHCAYTDEDKILRRVTGATDLFERSDQKMTYRTVEDRERDRPESVPLRYRELLPKWMYEPPAAAEVNGSSL